MADPARRLPEANDPRIADPRVPVGSVDPLADAARNPSNFEPANTVDNRTVVQGRGMGNGAIVAAVVVALAILAYFFFAPGTADTPPVTPTTTSEPAPATPPATEPSATAPAPAAPAAPAPAPAAPAPAN